MSRNEIRRGVDKTVTRGRSIRVPSDWIPWASEFQRRWHAETSAIKFVFMASLVNAVLYHLPLYSFAVADLDAPSFNGFLILVTLFIVIFLVTALILFLLLVLAVQLVKPICILLALGSSIALYFVATYHVVLDQSMMGNVLNTDFAEASSYLHPKLVLYLLIFGVVPGWFLSKIKLQRASRSRAAFFAFLTFMIVLGWAYLASSTWLWIDKNAKTLGGMVMPWSYVINMVRHQAEHLSRPQEQMALPPAIFTKNEKTVVILVIGEAARAQNFSLYGYGRPTNPSLAKSGAIALQNSVACSTYTTASLRCMLSLTDTSSTFPRQYEPLPSYLQRHGIDVIWRTRNWGEPPIQVNSYKRVGDLEQDCREPGCDYDEVLLSGLAERIRSSEQQKVFVVLHQRGSHGPSYYAEYPKQFEVFSPVCMSVVLDQCTDEELVNAYDNTILYTDHFLGRAIQMLDNLTHTSATLMYISDHGESLGEFGLYLHGTPLPIAPEFQKKIPFIVWMSSEFIDKNGISLTRIKQRQSHSHDNVFHSVMGAFDMRSKVYDDRLDIFNSGDL